jgi:hypothetical protein
LLQACNGNSQSQKLASAKKSLKAGWRKLSTAKKYISCFLNSVSLITVKRFVFSGQGAALLGGVNVLHTSFPEDPDAEYHIQGEPAFHGFCISGLALWTDTAKHKVTVLFRNN